MLMKLYKSKMKIFKKIKNKNNYHQNNKLNTKIRMMKISRLQMIYKKIEANIQNQLMKKI